MTTTARTARSLLGSGAFRRYRLAAWVVGVVLALMSVIGLPWKYLLDGGEALWYAIGWQLHGFLYMVYLITVVDLAIAVRWSPVRTALVGLAGTIPFMSFVLERRVTRELEARRDADLP